MCFFDQHRFACGDWKWGKFRQHCDKDYRMGQTCGMKLVMETIPTGGKCKLCEKINTKMRRRAAEVERVTRLRQKGHSAGALSNKSVGLVKGSIGDIPRLRSELRWQRLQAGSSSTMPNPIGQAEVDETGEKTTSTFVDEDSCHTGDGRSNEHTHYGQSVVEANLASEKTQNMFGTTKILDLDFAESQNGCGYVTSTNVPGFPYACSTTLNVEQEVWPKLMTDFSNILFERAGARHWAKYALEHHSLEEIKTRIEALLQAYVLNTSLISPKTDHDTLGAAGRNDDIRSRLLKLIQRCSSEFAICQSLMLRSLAPCTDTLDDLSQCLAEQLSVARKSSPSIMIDVGFKPSGTSTAYVDISLQLEKERVERMKAGDLVADFQAFQNVLEADDTFRLLVLGMQRQLYRDDRSHMTSIERLVVGNTWFGLNAGPCEARFNMSWSMGDFMRYQYGENMPSVGSVVTITGSALYAQATTCKDYITTTWPTTGLFLIQFVDEILLKDAARHDATDIISVSISSQQGLSIYAGLHNNELLITAYAKDEVLLVQLAQQLAWLSSTLSTSPYGDRLAYGEPLISSSGFRTFTLTVKHSPIHTSEAACWLPLFCGAVIAAGFPIPERATEMGLEISLELLAGLSGARHVVEYEGGVVMKSFSQIYVPVRKSADRVQWHAFCNPDPEERLSYRDGVSHCVSRATVSDISIEDAKSLRAIVGWCSVSKWQLGSDSANYNNIDYSKADEASTDSNLQCSGASLGFQQFGVAALDVRFGRKDGKCNFQQDGSRPFQRIAQNAEDTIVSLGKVIQQKIWRSQTSRFPLPVRLLHSSVPNAPGYTVPHWCLFLPNFIHRPSTLRAHILL